MVVRGFAPLAGGRAGPAQASGKVRAGDVVVVVEWSDMWRRPYDRVIDRYVHGTPVPVRWDDMWDVVCDVVW